MSEPPTNGPGKALALAGAVLQLGPVIGVLGTVAGTMRAFQTLGSRGIDNPRQLAAAMSIVLCATAAGAVLGLVGLILLLVSVFGCRYRAPWLFWFLVIYGGVMVFAYPVGTIIGAALLVICLTCRDQFLKPARTIATP